MTISTTASEITYQGDGANTNWPFGFLIPNADDLIVTLTLIADGSTQVLDPSVYSVTGIGDPNGGSVTYPLIGSPLANTYNITVQRLLPLTQETDLTNQGNFNPEVVEGEFDNLTMLVQQIQDQLNRALQFPVGATDTSVAALMAAILNGAANATAAENAATEAEAARDAILALLPLDTANIADGAITSPKLDSQSVIASKIGDTAVTNGVLVASVAANALTIAVKALDGTDPTVDNPVILTLRSATDASGTPTVIRITSAINITVPAGASLGAVNATPFRIWIVAFNDNGTVRLGVVNCLSGTLTTGYNVLAIGGYEKASSTAISSGATSAQTFYTGVSVAGKSFQILGYMEWGTGLATAGTWASGPTRVQGLFDDTPLPGTRLPMTQTNTGAVATGTAAIPYDDTIPNQTSGEGTEFMNLPVTLLSPANLIDVKSQLFIAAPGVTALISAMFLDAVGPAITACVNGNFTGDIPHIQNLEKTVQPGASSTTIRVRAGGSSTATVTFNGTSSARKLGGVMNSYIKAVEIMV